MRVDSAPAGARSLLARALVAGSIIVLGFASCETPRVQETVAVLSTVTLRVGDGSPGAYASLDEALRAAPAGARIELPEGDVPGAFIADKPLVLVGRGAFRTHLRPGPAVEAAITVRSAQVQISALSIEGGEVGVRVERGDVRLEEVALRRQRTTGLWLLGGSAEMKGGEVIETQALRGAQGILAAGGRLRVEGTLFRLAGHRAIEVKNTVAELLGVDILGSRQTGIQVLDGSDVRIAGGRIAGQRGNAIFAAAARVTIADVVLTGNEYGVLAARGARVTLEGGEISEHRVAGFALVNSNGSVRGARITHGGTEGGISVLGATEPVVVEDVQLVAPGPNGIHLTHSSLVLRRSRISGASADSVGDFGDAIYALESQLLLEGNTLVDNSGSGVALAISTLRGVDNELSRNGRAGVLATDRSEVKLSASGLSHNGSGIVVSDDSRAQLDGNRFEENALFAIDDCARGTVTENAPASVVKGPGRKPCEP